MGRLLRGGVIGVWFAGALCACGGTQDNGGGGASGNASGAGGASGDLGTEFVGIYSLDEFTQNAAACTPGTDSLRDLLGDTHLVIQRGSIQGYPVVTLASCAGTAACRELAPQLVTMPSAGNGLTHLFMRAEADGTLLGETIHYGTNSGTQCSDAGVEHQVLNLQGAALALELRAHLTSYPVDSDGACTLNAATTHASEAPCSRLRILTGTFVEPL
ncbi:MAG TPA: hypothetical protein VHO25_22535 [Polyangiaceae bacterium]|nr:hypothetical protein [Polyangiaceae bacterium]